MNLKKIFPSLSILLLCCCCIFPFVSCKSPPSSQQQQQQLIWPAPQHINITEDNYYQIDSRTFTIQSQSQCPLIRQAINRYLTTRLFIQDCSRLNSSFSGDYFHSKPYVFNNTNTKNKNGKNYLGKLEKLMIKFSGNCNDATQQYPYMNMSEMYYLNVEHDGKAELVSESVWGIIRGLDTFAQLVNNVGPNQYMIPTVRVFDYPRFAYRGVMIDTARHYLPLHSIYETLDAMEMNKFNVLHWHVVDDQSFPFVSTTYPQLATKGAFNARTHVYRPEQVKAIIEYARQRGIRVLAEFDTPGHTEAWGKGQPGLLTPCYSGSGSNSKPNGKFGPIDPISNATYEFVQKFFAEIAERFPDKYLHLGGDEVNFACWRSNPTVQKFMQTRKFGDNYARLESFYIQRLVQIVESLHKSYIVWQEVFDNGVTIKPDTVVHVWKGRDGAWRQEMESVTKKGYHVLLSSPWYLNYISYGTDWTKYYREDPYHFNGTDVVKQKFVLGGEACMWSEWVDASNLISRTWPRANAVAERLWSSQSLTDPAQAATRFHRQHCRMQSMGLRVQPNEGAGYYCPCDYAM